MTKLKTRFTLLLVVAPGLTAAFAIAAPAHADSIPPNCEHRDWGFLRLKDRFICDGPIQPDGSWMRTRRIGIPRHYEYPTTECSGGDYYSSCTSYPGGWVAAKWDDDETYPVTPDNVLPDEPGHLG
jgi:hypothetical protein